MTWKISPELHAELDAKFRATYGKQGCDADKLCVHIISEDMIKSVIAQIPHAVINKAVIAGLRNDHSELVSAVKEKCLEL